MIPLRVLIFLSLLLLPQTAQSPGGPASPSAAPAGSITVDTSTPGPRIPSSMYGIFFEEISHAGDGGLYAELIQNRGFEDARLPPMCTLDKGFVIPPRTPHFDTGRPSDFRLRWDVTSPTPAWSVDRTGGAAATMTLVDVEPLTPASPHSVCSRSRRPGCASCRCRPRSCDR